MRRRFPGAGDASLNLTESTFPGTFKGGRLVSHKLKNVSQRFAAVKYSVVKWLLNDRFQRDWFGAFNPSTGHNSTNCLPQA
jgi:hypothetical protein